MAEYLRPERARIDGRVTKASYAKGSKSERKAIFIEAGDARYLLRRKDGPAFADAKLEKFVGQAVSCEGLITGTTFIADHISVRKRR